jgi:23S rRNA (guanosine2251-2'-O)-methyltransferase
MRKLANNELGRLSTAEFHAATKFPFILILDNIRSLHNVGSVFRTADAFRIEELLLCGFTGCPPHREIQRTALDATESVKWKYFETTLQAVEYLHERNYKVYALEQTDSSILLQNFKIPEKDRIAIILGNEISGVEENLLPHIEGCIEIPQFGTKHSFNVAVSAGILLWELFNKCILANK